MRVVFRGGIESRYSAIKQQQNTHLPPSGANCQGIHGPRSVQGSIEGAAMVRWGMVVVLHASKLRGWNLQGIAAPGYHDINVVSIDVIIVDTTVIR